MSNAIERKAHAEQLLADPMVQEAFEKIEAGIVARLKDSASDHDAEWLMALRLMAKIKGWFIAQINNGKIEEFDEAQKEKKH